MYYSPPSLSSKAESIAITMVSREHHESLGVVRVALGEIGAIYFDFDSAMKLQTEIKTLLDEYLDTDVATYVTTTLDTSEVE